MPALVSRLVNAVAVDHPRPAMPHAVYKAPNSICIDVEVLSPPLNPVNSRYWHSYLLSVIVIVSSYVNSTKSIII